MPSYFLYEGLLAGTYGYSLSFVMYWMPMTSIPGRYQLAHLVFGRREYRCLPYAACKLLPRPAASPITPGGHSGHRLLRQCSTRPALVSVVGRCLLPRSGRGMGPLAPRRSLMFAATAADGLRAKSSPPMLTTQRIAGGSMRRRS